MSTPIEIRSDESQGTVTLSSYASLFEPVSYEIGGRQFRYVERVKAGAFTDTLRSNPDVVFRTEHANAPLARTSANNLTLTQDSRGLKYTAVLRLDDPDVRALIPKVEAGNLRESSFAFKVGENGESWNSTRTERTLHKLDLHRGDVSLVTFGASAATGQYTSLRSDGSPQERRAWADAISHSGWAGPGAVEVRWSNQHGATCESCNGSGQCQGCEGRGWTGHADPIDSQNPTVGRSLLLPPSRYAEFEAQLAELGGRR